MFVRFIAKVLMELVENRLKHGSKLNKDSFASVVSRQIWGFSISYGLIIFNSLEVHNKLKYY